MRMNTTKRAFIVALLALLTFAVSAHAYRMIQNTSTGRVTSGNLVSCNDPGGFTHWDTRTIRWYHNTAGQGSGKTQALKNALACWDSVPNAAHVLPYAGTTSAGWATDNKNTILWAVGNGCNTGCLALTALVLASGQEIIESDITFNSNYNWTTNGTNYDTQAVATHELGHALGIHHTELTGNPKPTMRSSYFGSDGRTLENDDEAALQCSESKYPLPPPPPLSGYIKRTGLWYPAQYMTAHVSGGTPPYVQYAWYRKPNCSGGGGGGDDAPWLPRDGSATDAKGAPDFTPPPQEDVPCTSWYGPTYTSSPPNKWTPYQGPNQNIRVIVTDSVGAKLTLYNWLP